MSKSVDLDLLFAVARDARARAYAPYSLFRVGAAVATKSGRIFGGCNVENAAYPATTCAEACAIGGMVAGGETEIAAILIVGAGDSLVTPCGNCRQIIREFGAPETPIHIAGPEGLRASFTLAVLLPESFGPENLSTQTPGHLK